MLVSTDSGLQGTGAWVDSGPASLEWWVTDNGNGSWHYRYFLTHPSGATSHFILETSLTFTENDIFNASGDFYAKNGKVPGTDIWNSVWNAGFAAADHAASARQWARRNACVHPQAQTVGGPRNRPVRPHHTAHTSEGREHLLPPFFVILLSSPFC